MVATVNNSNKLAAPGEELTFGVRMDGGGSLANEAMNARDALVKLKKATDDLAASSAKTAGAAQTDWAKVQQSMNASAAAWLKGNAAADAAADKAWALANGYKEVGGYLRKTGDAADEGMEKTVWATARAQHSMVTLGREVATGNFAQIPGTLSIIAQGLSPVALGVAGITAALAAGGYAWYEWGEDARYAAGAAREGLDAAKKAADRAQQLTQMERLAKMYEDISKLETESADLAAKSKRMGAAGEGGKGELWSYAATIAEKQREIAGLKRQALNLQEEIENKQAADRKRSAPVVKAPVVPVDVLGDQLDKDYAENRSRLLAEGAGMDVGRGEQQAYERKLEAAQFYHDQALTDESAYVQMRELIEANHQDKLVGLGRRGALTREQFEKLSGKNQLLIHTGIMKDIIGASAQHSQAMFSIMKVARLAEAAIALPTTVMHAYKSGMEAGGPFGPAVGSAYAALAFASQMIQINAIRSASFGGAPSGSAPSAGGVSSIAIPGQHANPGIVAVPPSLSVAAAPQREVNIYISGSGFMDATSVRNLIEQINEQVGDGVVLNVRPI